MKSFKSKILLVLALACSALGISLGVCAEAQTRYNRGGTLFEITPAAVYTPLNRFNYPNGTDPGYGPLFQTTDGSIYGTTVYGPSPCCYGTIFRLSNGLSRSVKTIPVMGKAGQKILVLGNKLTGSTAVTFDGVAADFTVEPDTYLFASVQAVATSTRFPS